MRTIKKLKVITISFVLINFPLEIGKSFNFKNLINNKKLEIYSNYNFNKENIFILNNSNNKIKIDTEKEKSNLKIKNNSKINKNINKDSNKNSKKIKEIDEFEIKEKINEIKKDNLRYKFYIPKKYRSFSKKIYSFLEEYNGPLIKITSGFRSWGGPMHRCGKAIDISWDIDVFNYFTSNEGYLLLEKYNLQFFVEDYKKDTKKELPEKATEFWRHVPWATGVHFHLEEK